MGMDVERFYNNSATQPETGCWLWTRYCDRDGYARSGNLLAHRVSYELSIGPIPTAMTVDHTCFQAACINPDHLRLLTHRENAALQRSALKTHCKNGHEFTPENTRRAPATGQRHCRACAAASTRRYLARKKAS